MVEEWRETRIHGRLGWKAMPFAREDLDSNLVSIEGWEVMAGYGEGASAPCMCCPPNTRRRYRYGVSREWGISLWWFARCLRERCCGDMGGDVLGVQLFNATTCQLEPSPDSLDAKPRVRSPLVVSLQHRTCRRYNTDETCKTLVWILLAEHPFASSNGLVVYHFTISIRDDTLNHDF